MIKWQCFLGLGVISRVFRIYTEGKLSLDQNVYVGIIFLKFRTPWGVFFRRSYFSDPVLVHWLLHDYK